MSDTLEVATSMVREHAAMLQTRRGSHGREPAVEGIPLPVLCGAPAPRRSYGDLYELRQRGRLRVTPIIVAFAIAGVLLLGILFAAALFLVAYESEERQR